MNPGNIFGSNTHTTINATVENSPALRLGADPGTAASDESVAHMVATPVSKRVNTPKNNDAELTIPVPMA